MEIFVLFWGGLLGLFVGSFLNVIIYRLNTEKSPFRGRSHCMNCNRTLSWYELMPVLSFVLQKGKCRGCKNKISLQYPVVEIMTAGIFLLIIFNFQFLISNEFLVTQFLKLIFLVFIASGLIVIFVYDLKHYLIPDKILMPLIILALLAVLFGIWNLEFIWSLEIGIWNFGNLLSAVALGILTALPFALLHFLSKGRAMGFGDIKFAFFMGILLGYPSILVAIFTAFMVGAIIGVLLLSLNKKSLKSKVPFAPFLVVGTFVGLFWGEQFASWYLNLIF